MLSYQRNYKTTVALVLVHEVIFYFFFFFQMWLCQNSNQQITDKDYSNVHHNISLQTTYYCRKSRQGHVMYWSLSELTGVLCGHLQYWTLAEVNNDGVQNGTNRSPNVQDFTSIRITRQQRYHGPCVSLQSKVHFTSWTMTSQLTLTSGQWPVSSIWQVDNDQSAPLDKWTMTSQLHLTSEQWLVSSPWQVDNDQSAPGACAVLSVRKLQRQSFGPHAGVGGWGTGQWERSVALAALTASLHPAPGGWGRGGGE